MYNIVSKLIIYGDMDKDSILMKLSDIIRKYKETDYKKDEIITELYCQVKRILEVSTDYGGICQPRFSGESVAQLSYIFVNNR